MSFVATADLHLGSELPGLNRFAIIKQMFRFAVDNDADAVVIAGDVYHHLLVSNSIREKFNRWIRKLSKSVQVIIIPGNHDVGSSTTSLSPITPLVNKNIKIVMEPTEIKIGKDSALFIPFEKLDSKDTNLFKKRLKKLKGKYKFVFGHFTVNGCSVGPSNFTMSHSISAKLLKKYFKTKYFILGHIHKPQVINENIYYCGSPDYLDFGEREEQKRFLYYNGKSLESIKVKGKQLCQVNVTPKSVNGKLRKNGLYKIVVECYKEEVGIVPLERVIKKIKEKGGRIIKTQWAIKQRERTKAKSLDFRNSVNSNIKEYIGSYANKEDRKQLLEEALSICQETGIHKE